MEEENEIQAEDENFNIEGTGAFNRKAGFDKPSRVDWAVANCMMKRSLEMKPGFTTFIRDKMGNVFPKTINDSRKEYIGSIVALTGLLRHELREYGYEEKYNKFKMKKTELKDKYAFSERTYIPRKTPEGKYVRDNLHNIVYDTIIIPEGRKWIPEKGDLIPMPVIQTKRGGYMVANIDLFSVEKQEKAWDNKVDAYWDGIVELCDDWFEELNTLISGPLKNFGRGIKA